MAVKSGDRGAALVVTLLAMTLVTALGIGIMILADTERLVAANFEAKLRDAVYGRRAMASPGESAICAGQPVQECHPRRRRCAPRFRTATRSPRLPSGVTLNLDAITVDVQSQSDALGPAGPNRPVWRLFAWGPLAQLPATSRRSSAGAAWVADDRFESGEDLPAG